MEPAFSDITIVIQGPIYADITNRCIDSIRKKIPDCHIILSTYVGSNVDNLDFDEVAFSEDVGSGSVDSTGYVNNTNRQITTTLSGIDKVKTKYLMKFRSDMYISSSNFISIYKQFCDDAVLFKKRLLICEYYTRNPRILPLPFHPSDWVLLGLTEDIKKYYSIVRLQSVEEDKWFLNNVNKHSVFRSVISRYTPEQHICLPTIEKNYNIKLDDYADINKINIIYTEKFFAENLLIIDAEKNGIIFDKYNPNRFFERKSLITFKEWRILYNHYKKNECILVWNGYILKCFFYKMLFSVIRPKIAYILDKFGIKEIIKKNMKDKI